MTVITLEPNQDTSVLVFGEQDESAFQVTVAESADPADGLLLVLADQDQTVRSIALSEPASLIVVDQNIGPKGDPGPQGDPAPLTWQTFVYTQDTVADVWTIAHGMPYPPNITVVDSSGRVVEGDVLYVSDTEIQVTFSAPFAGVAYLS